MRTQRSAPSSLPGLRTGPRPHLHDHACRPETGRRAELRKLSRSLRRRHADARPLGQEPVTTLHPRTPADPRVYRRAFLYLEKNTPFWYNIQV